MTVNGVTAQLTNGGYVAMVPLASEGEHRLQVTAIDAAGNRTDSTRTVIKDSEVPVLALSEPVDGAVTKEGVVVVAGTVHDRTAVTVNVNGAPLTVDADGRFAGQVALAEGTSFVTVTATDAAGNASSVVRSVVVDQAPPQIAVSEPAEGATVAAESVAVKGTMTDATEVTLTVNGTAAVLDAAGAFEATVTLDEGANTITLVATDRAANSATVTRTVTRAASEEQLPPDPASIAPALDRTIVPSFARSTEFLYTAANPVQRGVQPGAVREQQAAVLRGRVLTREGQPLPGVRISVIGRPELGYTLSRADGRYDLVVNGGGAIRLAYEKQGHLPIERAPVPRWQEYNRMDDVALIPLDTVVTIVDFSQPMQIARSSRVSDADGAREAVMMFRGGTQAALTFPDGSVRPAPSLSVRATEYTVGGYGAAAMPAPLPPVTAYTYAVELSADEEIAAGATGVVFDKPVSFYVDNFLRFPVGYTVPVGYFDRQKGRWLTAPPARVIEVLAVSNGLAGLAVDTTREAASAERLAEFGIDAVELTAIAAQYDPGQTLWRSQVSHFTPFDLNPNRYDDYPPASPPDDGSCDWRCEMLKKLGATKVEFQKNCTEAGSIIDCDNRALGERLPLVGTPYALTYRSNNRKMPGNYELDVPISGDSVPSYVTGFILETEIAGQSTRADFGPEPNLTYHFVWNGLDAYGRALQGPHRLRIRIGVLKTARLRYWMSPARTAQFGIPCNFGIEAVAIGLLRNCIVPDSLLIAFGVTPRSADTTWVEFGEDYQGETLLGEWDMSSGKLGGWGIDVHHVLNRSRGVLNLGDGTQRRAVGISRLFGILNTVAGTGRRCSAGQPGCERGAEGSDALNANINVEGLAVGPDGSVYFSDVGRIRRVTPQGTIVTVAGTGTPNYAGDGGPALEAQVDPGALAFGPDGSLYFSDYSGSRVRKIDPAGIVTTVAGNGNCAVGGYGLPATQAPLCSPYYIAVGPDGALFISQYFEVRRVGPEGIMMRYAGIIDDWCIYGYQSESCGDGGSALDARFNGINGIAVGPDGRVYVADDGNDVIRVIRADGIIERFAGDPDMWDVRGDGGPAISAGFSSINDIALTPDGGLYVLDRETLRLISPDGTINTVAGVDPECSPWEPGPLVCQIPHTNGGSARQARLGFSPQYVVLGPDGHPLIADWAERRIVRLEGPVPNMQSGDLLMASEDGGAYFEFDHEGRHVRTWNALTRTKLFEFEHDSAGLLTAIRDAQGNTTTIERRADGVATAIVAPFGQRTVLAMDANGHLASVARPGGAATQLEHLENGLLVALTDPEGGRHTFDYTYFGQLTDDVNPDGGSKTLVRDGPQKVRVTTAEGRTTTYGGQYLPKGITRRTVTGPDGHVSESLQLPDGYTETRTPDRTVTRTLQAPDPRFGMEAPYLKEFTLTTPGGRSLTLVGSRTVQLANLNDPFSLERLVDSVAVNGNVWTSTFDAAARTATSRSAAGRTSVMQLDATGRIVEAHVPGLASRFTTYDAHGRISRMTQSGRSLSFTYGSNGRVSIATDALGRDLQYRYDAADRLSGVRTWDGRELSYDYDQDGRIVAVTPAGRPAHRFTYTPGGLLESYVAPAVPGLSETATRYTYNRDGQMLTMRRPDGSLIRFEYDTAGRRTSRSFEGDTVTTQYDTTSGMPTTLRRSRGGGALRFSYDGVLLRGVEIDGASRGNVTFDYDTNFRVSGIAVNGSAVDYRYDPDGKLTGVGALALTLGTESGLLRGTQLQTVSTSREYDEIGSIAADTVRAGNNVLYAYRVVRDAGQRIVEKVETVAGQQAVMHYAYDSASRLAEVRRDGQVVATYEYDQNGNRVQTVSAAGAVVGTYDDQDRLLGYGSATFGYSAAGELRYKAVGSDTTRYRYDAFNNLLGVTLADGTEIEYVADAMNRRTARKVNGAIVQRFLYSGGPGPVAEVDANGAVLTRFVYGTHVNVPDYMVRGGIIYRFVLDHLGSVRLVVHAGTGETVQRLAYDEYGRVLENTNPGFQPFGFGGGLVDPQTELVRFGARDYDPTVGRWTTRDPLGLLGGTANSYEYASSDPVNYVDPFGLCSGFDGWKNCDRMVNAATSEYIAMTAYQMGEWTYSQHPSGGGFKMDPRVPKPGERLGDCTDLVREATRFAIDIEGNAWSRANEKSSTKMFRRGNHPGFTEIDPCMVRPGDVVVQGKHAGIFQFWQDGKPMAWANNGKPHDEHGDNYEDNDTGVRNFSEGKFGAGQPLYFRPIVP